MKNSLSLLLFLVGAYLQAQDFTVHGPIGGIGNFTIADFDGDGDNDIFGIAYNVNDPSAIYWYKNTGSSPISFEEIPLGDDYGAKGFPDAGDYDGDGDMDILLAKGNNTDIHVLKNDGTGIFEDVSLNVGGSRVLRFHDLEGDGDLDFIGLQTNGFLNVYVNDGTQSYTKKNVVGFPSEMIFAAADLDSDGDIDIVSGYFEFFGGVHLETHRNNGDNTFTTNPLATDVFPELQQMAIVDINKDGKLDIGAVNNTSFNGWINDGNFQFTMKTLAPYSGTSMYGFISIDIMDVNGDEIPDPVTGDKNGPIVWYKNISTNPVQYEKRTVGGVAPVYVIKHADLDMDGDYDLVVSNEEMWIFENKVEQISALKESNFKMLFEIFPNPIVDLFNVRSQVTGNFTYDILDMDGIKVHSGKLISDQMNFPPLAPGTYVLSILDKNTGKRFSEQVIKN